MTFIDFYYRIKPVVPRSIQLLFRRVVAKQKRLSRKGIWPIDTTAAEKPQSWEGWPGNKRFAIVLQHDVDTEEGRDRCAQIVELEKSLGFRSCFNFVPEDYFLPRKLRQFLADSGFEVGVHGLKHDGKNFLVSAFQRRLPKINHYLREWGANGFTSPSMLRNLNFMLALNIEYGCTTFDTDPFEPHSDGFSTIFPFTVQGADASKSYVELPYTLPQDHCLFIILRERNIRIWKEKLDWIVANGGMVLLNSHPDYMDFGDNPTSCERYPAVYYQSFLEYLRRKYAGQYWQPLPREIARFWRKSASINNAGVKQKITRSLNSHKSILVQHANKGQQKAPKIWIDLDNTPHVPFFLPIIKELERRGYQIELTARDAFQVCELAKAAELRFVKVGHHYGKNQINKVLGLISRAAQLISFRNKKKPDFALSHGARSQILLCNVSKIPTILIADYEHSRTIPFARPQWMIVPAAITPEMLGVDFSRIRQYPGIKEDVYVPAFSPDPSMLNDLGLNGHEIIVTVRPPADEAHYYNPESNVLFYELMARAIQIADVRIVLLPRNRHQEETLRANYPEWFAGEKSIIPKRAVNGLNLIWQSDLVVSGGGTMNRESAAMGVPVYSIFRGVTGAVDTQLELEGRLTMIRSKEEVWTKIRIEGRKKELSFRNEPRPALEEIVYHIENIIEIENAKRRRAYERPWVELKS